MRKGLLITVSLAIATLLLVWGPFALHLGRFWGVDFSGHTMQTIVKNFDGINFLIVAKSLYDPQTIEVDFASVKNWRENLYFSAHYPLFPLLIRSLDTLMDGQTALLLAIALSNAMLATSLYLFFSHVIGLKNKNAVIITLISLFLPARMLAVRSVGSNEPLFISLILLSLLFNKKGKHWWAAVTGSLAILTRSPGILLFVAYALSILATNKKNLKKSIVELGPYLVMPLTILGLWAFYGYTYGSFFAYFKVGGNINLYFPPFLVFGSHNPWASGMWLEDIIYTYLLYAIGIGRLLTEKIKNKISPTLLFAGIYLASVFFIVHRDIGRYCLPIAPFMLAGFSDLFDKKYVKYIIIALFVPVLLWSWQFILQNVQPVMDWTPYL